MKSLPPSAVILLALGAAVASAQDPDAKPPLTADLICETMTLRPGTDATIGVRLVLEEHWHTYWKNPGESGFAPRVAWTLPAGFEAGPLQFPAPIRIDAGGVAGYGYEGEVVLPVTLKVPAKAAGDVTIGAKVTWLACKEACVPGDSRVELKLAVKDAAPVADVKWTQVFAATRARLPQKFPAGAVQLESSADRLTLTMTPAAGCPADRVTSVRFFPAAELVIDPEKPVAIEPAALPKLRVRLTPAPRRKELVQRLEGVLVVMTDQGEFPYEIDVTASTGRTPGAAGEKSK